MALTYDLSEVPESIRLVEEDGKTVMAPVSHALIFLTMSVGMGEITEKNWPKFWARVDAEQKLHGARLNQKGEDGEWKPQFITPRDVRDHIGLRTNVGRMSDAAWRKCLTENFLRRAERDCETLEN
tara:strand:- start:62 stop:439 length:378 start_codon:yes stop_codon:yes gene_type:complete